MVSTDLAVQGGLGVRREVALLRKTTVSPPVCLVQELQFAGRRGPTHVMSGYDPVIAWPR